ncbi:sigma-70 family RNA polymerase sigma factor [Fusibacter ferrireducens]|uniref:Sigma-70 family RNA polymerase sigma factor n=1 Tax=Fusibacter ferrireducens TaxID=2785058 RepID=A0ABR9ZRJ3_9FIRM|nr:sigma-70 family RNA polymerase sigma factor [Fusibacter ferrireducens]MBF4693074.1 sigma-70 family RNA polymerase sigma factor [Fusibacter ferrireducens]
MDSEEFAKHIEQIRMKLYKTALLYIGNESAAIDILDETVYKALRGYKKLRQPEYFDTWITRILINECHNERKRLKRCSPMAELPESAVEDFDALPLKEAVGCLPKALKEVVILRYFSGYTLKDTANALQIPLGTAATRQRRALALLRIELGEEEVV